MRIDEASYIEHFGTKGMKWGVRKSVNGSINRREKYLGPKKKRIKEARSRHNARADAILAAKSKAEVDKIVSQPGAFRDAVTAGSVSRGKRLVTVLLLGPVGLIPIAAIQNSRRQNTTGILDGKA